MILQSRQTMFLTFLSSLVASVAVSVHACFIWLPLNVLHNCVDSCLSPSITAPSLILGVVWSVDSQLYSCCVSKCTVSHRATERVRLWHWCDLCCRRALPREWQKPRLGVYTPQFSKKWLHNLCQQQSRCLQQQCYSPRGLRLPQPANQWRGDPPQGERRLWLCHHQLPQQARIWLHNK